MTNNKMKIEVWTDIMCPYCYIGKKYYEQALEKFPCADDVELVIKAFQLNPGLPGKGKGMPVVDYLTNVAGFPEDNVRQMFTGIEKLAEIAGVKFNLPNAYAANTRDAHRLVKLAAQKGLDSKVLSLISKAYFEDAKDYSDIDLLVQIGVEAGLDETEIREMFAGDDFNKEVEADIAEANELKIDTVPTFLFNRQYSIVGSESPEVFLSTLNKAYENWKSVCETSTEIKTRKGKSCSADGVCEI